MKKTILTLIAILSLTPLFAQIRQSVGFQFGFEQDIFRYNTNNYLQPKKLTQYQLLNGGQVGLAYEILFWKGLGIYVNANYAYTTKVEKLTPAMANDYQTQTITKYHSINIPLHLQYKILLANQTWITIYVGPTFQYAISREAVQVHEQPILKYATIGQEKNNTFRYTFNYYTVHSDSEFNKYSDADGDFRRDFNRFNPLMGLGIALQFHQFYLRGGYNFGIANNYYDRTQTKEEWSRRSRNDQWSIAIGWYFAYTE